MISITIDPATQAELEALRKASEISDEEIVAHAIYLLGQAARTHRIALLKATMPPQIAELYTEWVFSWPQKYPIP